MNLRALALLALVPVGAIAVFACVGSDVPPPAEVSCPRYCSDIATVCTGDNSQYVDTLTCGKFCGQMTLGTLANLSEDSVACRLTNVSNAKELGSEHDSCVFAGIASNCGATGDAQCDAFCKLDLALCGNLAYASQAECTAACASWSKVFTGPTIGATGDTLQCRVYHLQLSQTGNAADRTTHCPHTAAGTIGFGTAKCNSGAAGDGGIDAAPADAAGGG